MVLIEEMVVKSKESFVARKYTLKKIVMFS